MGFLNLFNSGTSDTNLADSLQFAYIRNDLQDIENLLRSGSIVTKAFFDTRAIINPLETTIKQAEQNTIGVIGGKIYTATNVINNRIINTENRILGKIQGLAGVINNDIDAIADKLGFNLTLINDNIKKSFAQQSIKINNLIDTQNQKLGNAINQVQNKIIDRVAQLDNTFALATKQEIQADKLNVEFLVNALNNLFEDLPEDLADEISKILNSDNIDKEKDIVDYLVGKLETPFKDALVDAFKSNAFRDAIHPKENQFLNFINTIFNGLNSVENVVSGIVNVGGEVGNQLSNALNIIGVDDVLRLFVQYTIEPYMRHILHQASKGARSDLLTVEQALSLFLYDVAYTPKVKEILRFHGHTDEDINLLMDITERPLDLETLQRLYYRKEIDTSQLNRAMWRLGFHTENAEFVRKLWDIIPPIQDIIRMAVRDVFSPEIVNEFGLMEDLPPDFVKWAEKSGLNEEWTKNYWGAHWNLPSALQGFEMFQRQIITREQLESLLKGLDITPRWRDFLVQLNYNPITRVDVRRMRKLGFLDFDEMVKRYRDVGYSPDDAKLMAVWTDAENDKGSLEVENQTRQLTQAMIIKGYRNGLIDDIKAISMLNNLGYNNENARFILQLNTVSENLDAIPDKLKDNYRRLENLISSGYIKGLLSENEAINKLQDIGFTLDEAQAEITFLDYELDTQLNEMIIDAVRIQFIQYQITIDRTKDILRTNGFNDNEINRLISQWNIQRLFRNKLPTKAEIKGMLQKQVIDIGTAQSYLRGNGYPDDIVSKYIEWWGV